MSLGKWSSEAGVSHAGRGPGTLGEQTSQQPQWPFSPLDYVLYGEVSSHSFAIYFPQGSLDSELPFCLNTGMVSSPLQDVKTG